MKKQTLCIVGLGYVGLPLAHAFAKAGYKTYGYDIDTKRIQELIKGFDRTRELVKKELKEAPIRYSSDPLVIGKSSITILTIPTPVDEQNTPDLSLVESATKTVGTYLTKGSIVVYESTVYPGVTEEMCGPILEKESHLKCGRDFTLGYSPERINPGDREHRLPTIKKIVSGQDSKTLDTLAKLYGSIITAGVHKAPSIKVAEMAKAIENAQRDLNIAYVNEIALFCNRLGIATKDVLEAAGTKWNFLPFKPGLVGGHCIGVDPYYLVEKAKQIGITTQVITAGRALNDNMPFYVAAQVRGALKVPIERARVLVLGLTFKEDVPDTRNSKSQEVVFHLKQMGCSVEVLDPFLSVRELRTLGLTPGSLKGKPYNAILLLVPHREYRELPPAAFLRATKPKGVIYDLKSILPGKTIQSKGRTYLAL